MRPSRPTAAVKVVRELAFPSSALGRQEYEDTASVTRDTEETQTDESPSRDRSASCLIPAAHVGKRKREKEWGEGSESIFGLCTMCVGETLLSSSPKGRRERFPGHRLALPPEEKRRQRRQQRVMLCPNSLRVHLWGQCAAYVGFHRGDVGKEEQQRRRQTKRKRKANILYMRGRAYGQHTPTEKKR